MEEENAVLQKANSDLLESLMTAQDDRVQEKKEFEGQREDLMKEKARIQIELNATKLELEDTRSGGDNSSQLDKLRQENAKYRAELNERADIQSRLLNTAEKRKADYDTLLRAYNEASYNNAVLNEQLKEGLPRAWRGSSDEDSRGLKRQLKRYQNEVARRDNELAKLRSENHNLRWQSFQKASDMIEHCNNLLDPRATVCQTLMAMAEYADGNSGTLPKGEQVKELKMFQGYIEERTEKMEEAFTEPNPVSVLDEFDEKWKGMLSKHDWGVISRLHVAATKAAGLIKAGAAPAEYAEALEEMNQFAKEAKDVLGDAFQAGELVEEINDRVDEIQHR